MKKKAFILILFLFCSTILPAQLSRTHYIPPITAAPNNNSLPQNQYLHISTPSISPVNVELNQLGGAVLNYNVSNSNPVEVFIGSGDNTPFVVPPSATGSQINNKGYIVSSEKPIYVSIRLTAGNQNQAGSLVSKGLSGLGNIFRVGTFTNLKTFSSSNLDYINFVTVMATENNTQVDFTDIPGDVIVLNNTPLSTILNAGESYILALNPALTPSNRDGLIGALVTSSKPIVVNCGSFNGSNSNGNGRDAGIDQIAPLETIAIDGQEFSEYIFVRANGYDDIERPLIVAHYDNTEVWINGDSSSGSLLTTVNAGEYISIDGSNFSTQSLSGSNPGGNLYVWTSKTTFAYQGIGGTNSEANQELFFVPPLNCKAPRSIDNIPLIQSSGSGDVAFNGGVTVVAEAGAVVSVNGSPTTAIPQNVNGNSNYVTYLIGGLSGNVSVASDGQIYVSYYGANGAAALGGFYSGFIFKPEIASDAIDVATQELCIPFIELSLGSEETFDAYQWFYNGASIAGATNETHIPSSPGFYQLEGVILDCSSVLSDNIPVSGCAGDYDNDSVNNNLDYDLDNDGILNVLESNCDFNFDLSASSGPYFTSTFVSSTANTVAVPFQGFSDQSMLLSAAPTVGTVLSTTTYQLSFDAPTQFRIEQASAAQSSGAMEDSELYILSVPYDETVSVYNPDNQLLIDVNYDGVYDNNITSFTAFEIRFKLNAATLATGGGTFSFQSQNATQFEIKYINSSEINSNEVAFQLTQSCRALDSDGDSITDNFDLDSDNDGIYDLIESGNSILDADQDGMVDTLAANDSNNDGHHDNTQDPVDTDSDFVYDYLDLDSDNDGLYDLFEAGIGVNTQDLDNNGQIDLGFADGNSNGVSDIAEPTVPLDSDSDGLPDFTELDSDSDGCFDVDEAGFAGTLGILDGTGIDDRGLIVGGNGYNFAIDTNADGLFDFQEYIAVIPAAVNTPQFICESGGASLQINLESNSDSYDDIFWEQSLDGGVTWITLAETPSSFENVNTNTLEILNVSISFSSTLFRTQMIRNDLVCQTFFSDPIELIIHPLPVIVSNVNLFQCDQNTDGVTIFNLNEANALISSNYTNELFSYYYNYSDAEQGNTNTIANPIDYENISTDPLINPNKIFVRVETLEGCALVSELDLFVSTTQVPAGFSIPLDAECYDVSDGITSFDFSASEAIILNLFPPTQSLTVSYFETESDALSEINPIIDISSYENTTGSNQTIWIRLDSDIDNSCVGLGPYIELVVNPLPDLNTPINPFYCAFGPNSLTVDLDLDFNPVILGNQAASDFTVVYYSSLLDANNNTAAVSSITNTTSLETVFYRISNNITGCYDISQFDITFFDTPQNNTVLPFVECETDNDGLFLFDTSNLESTVLGSQSNMSIAYFDAWGNLLQDANGADITSPFPAIFLTASQTITVVVSNATCVDAVIDIDFVVHPNTNFLVEDVVICNGTSELIELELEDPTLNFNYQWALPDLSVINTTQPELVASQLGEYQVTVSNLNGSCSQSQFFEVFESEPPSITLENITIVEGTSNNSIVVDEAALGSANYEFELVDENGNLVAAYQDTGNFYQLTGGFYSLYVRDELQCAEVVITVPVLYIPNFFTPNNDGYNDTWGIKGVISGDYIFSKISIFDRYGKLLKNMSINSNFWNGTYNGARLPTSDYWYAIELTKSDGSVFVKQGHFTLRR